MLILIRSLILYTILDKLPNLLLFLEVLTLQITINRSTLTIIGTYRHPNSPLTMGIINSFYTFMNQFPLVLLMGDFNTHHSFWGSTRSNSAGSTLYEFIDPLNLSCNVQRETSDLYSHTFITIFRLHLPFCACDLIKARCLSRPLSR
ncbi:hypothetical protein ALC56_11825 [Trachymyrmex septentrionalis]|uniref:Endonuclease/exonuclease/phosphatase domain-containing protein n=1 Tax=Trachymyrmex septentrionalis TaxID=34720 RepID=A0A151JTV9_9HYME|nr:hypothetical protein ALC56_11825 [Trachymyrmex septentrionalis]